MSEAIDGLEKKLKSGIKIINDRTVQSEKFCDYRLFLSDYTPFFYSTETGSEEWFRIGQIIVESQTIICDTPETNYGY